MKVFVYKKYKKENSDFICPYCNKKIKLGKIEDIILSNDNIKDTIEGIKYSMENVIKISPNNIIIQLKNINTLLDFLGKDIDKNSKKLKNLLSNEVLNNINEINNSIIKKGTKFKNGTFVGQVVNGKKEGKGIFYGDNGDIYEGYFKKDKKEGKGVYYWNNGDIFKGDYKNGKREGKGTYYNNNGDRYEGDWKNGKKEGKGIYYCKNGDRDLGDWKDGKEIGKHVILCNNGEAYLENY